MSPRIGWIHKQQSGTRAWARKRVGGFSKAKFVLEKWSQTGCRRESPSEGKRKHLPYSSVLDCLIGCRVSRVIWSVQCIDWLIDWLIARLICWWMICYLTLGAGAATYSAQWGLGRPSEKLWRTETIDESVSAGTGAEEWRVGNVVSVGNFRIIPLHVSWRINRLILRSECFLLFLMQKVECGFSTSFFFKSLDLMNSHHFYFLLVFVGGWKICRIFKAYPWCTFSQFREFSLWPVFFIVTLET